MRSRIQKLSGGVGAALRAVLPGPAAGRRSARRWLALKALTRLRREITFRRSGFLWTGATASSITQAIYTTGHYQDAHWDSLRGWLERRADFARPVIVNVGANIGDVALPLSRSGKRIIAIEPNPETFARLQRNVRQNGLARQITGCDVAIAEQAGTAQLVVTTDPGNSELGDGHGRLGFDGMDKRRGSVAVRTERLDTLLQSLGIRPDEVALVWSDTQGFESHVIASGSSLWRGGTPLWVEIWPKGLACHGGLPYFLELCRTHFTRVMPLERLGNEPEPIGALDAIVAGLGSAEFTDALLVP